MGVSQLMAMIPEVTLLGMLNVILLASVFLRYRHITYWLIQGTFIGVFLLTLPQYSTYSEPFIALSGHYIVDRLAVITKLFIGLVSFFACAYAHGYVERHRLVRDEYYLLHLFAVLGMFVMVSAYSFLTMYLGLELLSIALYAVIALHQKSQVAAEAAMKYFVLGALASGLFLYGVSLLYGVTGATQIDQVAQGLSAQSGLVPLVALIFVLGALVFKLGAVPFHMWVPDVYQGAPTPVTLFIASAAKIAAFVMTIRVLVQAMPSLHLLWMQILAIVAILSMFFGNLLAIAQTNLKRMLAYSSIAHMGYTLLGILAGPDSAEGYSAALFYISTYVIVAGGAFAIITLLSRDGMEFDQLSDYRGLNARHPWLAFMMLLLMFSMAGIPPTVGFFAKLGLLEALVEAHLTWLAVLALIFALIGAYYYLRMVMFMYFEEPTATLAHQRIQLSPSMLIAISINGSAALLLGLLPSFFIDICRITVG